MDRLDSPRLLAPEERATLAALLEYADFPGRDELRAQVDAVQVVGKCGCGCASVYFSAGGDPATSRERVPAPIPNEADVLDREGAKIGGILVFARDGRLSQLEVYGHSDEPINPFPPVGDLEIHSHRH